MRTAALAVLLLSAVPCQAQDKPSLKLPTAAYITAASADLITTGYNIHHGAHETNPLIGWVQDQYGPKALIGVAIAADVAVLYSLHKLVAPKHPKIAKVALWSLTAARVAATGINTHRGIR